MGRSSKYDFGPDWFADCGAITNLATANFSLAGKGFGVDNENDDAVFLEVKFMNSDTFINKKFQPGPNPYLIKEIKQNILLTADQLGKLKYGQ